jgi:hypothetical protein
MKSNEPGFFRIIRAPFLSSILAPLFFGTLLAVSIQAEFSVIGFVLLLVLGSGLHSATNVYNDIYDTLQGTDTVNRHRNEFSGGSGILVTHPHLGAPAVLDCPWGAGSGAAGNFRTDVCRAPLTLAAALGTVPAFGFF